MDIYKVNLYYPDFRDLKSDSLTASLGEYIKYITLISKSEYIISHKLSKSFISFIALICWFNSSLISCGYRLS
jgi:hypothetical protein